MTKRISLYESSEFVAKYWAIYKLGLLLCFLGFNVCSFFSATAQGTWMGKANFAGPARQLAVSFAIGCKLYAGGGSEGGSDVREDFWEWTPSTNAWIKKGNLPAGMIRAVGFSIGNKGYIGFGGYGGYPNGDFYEYDPLTDHWKAIAHFPGLPRNDGVGFSLGNYGYVGPGYAYDQASNFLDNVKDFWRYDPGNDEWV